MLQSVPETKGRERRGNSRKGGALQSEQSSQQMLHASTPQLAAPLQTTHSPLQTTHSRIPQFVSHPFSSLQTIDSRTPQVAAPPFSSLQLIHSRTPWVAAPSFSCPTDQSLAYPSACIIPPLSPSPP